MRRRPLLELLRRYGARFPQEATTIDRVRHLVENHADCFERTCRPGHITAAAWILSADRRRVLLAHHRKLDRWLQLGGHADGQVHVEEVALREAREESGIDHFEFVPIDGELLPLDVDVHTIPARFDDHGQLVEDAHEHHDIRFLLLAPPDPSLTVSVESHNLGWFTPDEVTRLTDEASLLRMLDKCLELM